MVLIFANLCFLLIATSFPSWNCVFLYSDVAPQNDLWWHFFPVLSFHAEMIHSIFNRMEILSSIASKYVLTFQFSFSLPLSVSRDLLRIGVTLAGHQKKILSNIQSMRVQMSQSSTTMAWLQGALYHGTGSIRRTNNNSSPRMTPDPSERARVETIVLI